MKHAEEKMIREAGTPALLCFKPEERPAGCRITSFINMKNRGTLHGNVICAYSEPSRCFLTVSAAPFTYLKREFNYLNVSLKNEYKQTSKNLIFKRDNYNISPSCNFGSVVQGRFYMLFGENWKIIPDNLFPGYASSKQLENLPDHHSGSFECKSSSTNFAVCDNVVADFNSHEVYADYGIFKDFEIQLGQDFQNYGSGISELMGREFQNKMQWCLGPDFQNWENGDEWLNFIKEAEN